MKSEIFRKLSSRKLWAAAAGVVVGAAAIFGLDEGVIGTVSGAVVTIASLAAYIITEGRIDAAAVGIATAAVQAASDAITGEEG